MHVLQQQSWVGTDALKVQTLAYIWHPQGLYPCVKLLSALNFAFRQSAVLTS